jgi:SAM-dependent methyltransferase
MTKTMKHHALAVLLAIGMILGTWVDPGGAEVKKDVPYVPTPQHVVNRMLQIAQVSSSDYVIDLGCGDGRIVITAARDRGARGFGVDIDPQRIEESIANAQREGVTDMVEFRVQNLFDTDISKASVLTLYLLPVVNLQLRPRILTELRPGTRVVSHDFDMGEWDPDHSEMLDYSAVFFWVVPANVSGEWAMNDGREELQIVLEQEFQNVRGTAWHQDRELPLKNVSLRGDRLSFTLERMVNGKLTPVTYRGKAEGNRITGDREPGQSPWSAERKPGTERPLDDHAIERSDMYSESPTIPGDSRQVRIWQSMSTR